MSVSYIPVSIRSILWGKSAGRCQYSGCNESLFTDGVTQEELNASYVAHIIADSPNGPRGDTTLSELLKADISNLMLMCDKHHRLIDKHDVEGHPVEMLREMKAKHEARIEMITSVKEEKQSHILIYTANVGSHNPIINWDRAASAMYPDYYPAERQAIELGLKNSTQRDHSADFWKTEREHLAAIYAQYVKPRLNSGNINHLSAFGLAPMPLLFSLGYLMSDITQVETYQLHREPQDWRWQPMPNDFEFNIIEPKTIKQNIALNLSLSATINNERITSVLGDDTSIWTITHKDPNNDFLKSRHQLQVFRGEIRKLLDKIKAQAGEGKELNVFPAAPVSVCIDFGRIIMPKADLPITIYDQNKTIGGFIKTFTINQ